MRLVEATFRYLSGVAGVTTLIGSGTNCRLYELTIPQDPTFPLVVMEQVSDERPDQFDGLPTIAQKHLEFVCYSRTNQTASDALADAIYAALMGNETAWTAAAGSLTVNSCHFVGRTYAYEWDNETGDGKLYSTTITFAVYHQI